MPNVRVENQRLARLDADVNFSNVHKSGSGHAAVWDFLRTMRSRKNSRRTIFFVGVVQVRDERRKLRLVSMEGGACISVQALRAAVDSRLSPVNALHGKILAKEIREQLVHALVPENPQFGFLRKSGVFHVNCFLRGLAARKPRAKRLNVVSVEQAPYDGITFGC